MIKKILGMVVGMLLIVAAVPAVGTYNAINATVPSTPLTSRDANWTQIQKLLASDGAAGDMFGHSVSLSGDTALIGVLNDDDNGINSGSAYVFIRTGTTWSQQGKLLASDGAANDYFGYAVSLSGDTALIGAYGHFDNGGNSGAAYVFTRTGATWTQQRKLLALDGAANDWFGNSVALSGDTALVGAPYDDDNGDQSGSAYVFTRTGTTWTQQQKLLALDGAAGDWFGNAVALSGDTALIGAHGDNYNGTMSGSAYVFIRTGTTWAQQQKILPLDGAANDYFGYSVSLSGNTALVGAPVDSDNGVGSGSVFVFTRTGTTWTQQQKLLALDGAGGDYFGYSVSLSGNTALIGAQQDDDNGDMSGSAYVFTRTGTIWAQQQKLLALDGSAGDYLGWSVALSGDTALIGAFGDDDNGANSGAVYVFTRPGLTFRITGGLGVNLKITNNGTEDAIGVSWQIHVQGGFLGKINKTITGTVDIPARESKTVGSGLFFGLGSIAITAKVGDKEKIATGTQFIIFSRVK